MSQATLPSVKSLVDQLSTADQLALVQHVVHNLKAVFPTPSHFRRQPLRGLWKGKFPDDFDLDATLKEIRGEWEKEWDENGEFVG